MRGTERKDKNKNRRTSTMTQASESKDTRPSSLPAVVGIVILLGAAAFIGWGLYKAMRPAPAPMQGMMDGTTISVSAKIPGRIDAIEVKEGDVLQKGDIVARISIPEIEAKLAQAQAVEKAAQAKASLVDEGPRKEQLDAARADLSRARAGLTLAEATYKRLSALQAEGFISQQKLDEAAAQKKSAAQLVNAAQAQLAALEEGAREQEKAAAQALAQQAGGGVAEVQSLAGESAVASPIAGEVTRIVMHAGEVAPAGFPLVLVTDLDDQWASFNVREDELPGMTVGAEIETYLPALGKTVAMRIDWINPRGDYAVWRATRQSSGYDLRTFEVRARPTAKVEGLRPGMTVIVDRSGRITPPVPAR